MIKYLRIKELLFLTLALLAETILTIAFFTLLLLFAKHYSSHKTILIIIGVLVLMAHGAVVALSVLGLSNQKKFKDPNGYVVVDFRKQAYYNAMIGGWIIYPLFVAYYAWLKSGYSENQIKQATRNYIKKHIEIILDSEVFQNKMSSELKTEVKNIKKLENENYLTKIEGSEYLYREFFNQGVITDFIIDELSQEYIDQIVELEL